MNDMAQQLRETTGVGTTRPTVRRQARPGWVAIAEAEHFYPSGYMPGRDWVLCVIGQKWFGPDCRL